MLCAVGVLLVFQGAASAEKKGKKKKATRITAVVQAAGGLGATCGDDLGPGCGLGAPTPATFGCPGVCPRGICRT